MQRRYGRMLALIAAAVLLFFARRWLWQGACQVFWGALAAFLALPAARRLERTLPAGPSALLALGAAGAAVALLLLVVLPPLVQQLRHFAQMLPSLLEGAGALVKRGQSWLMRSGIPIDAEMQQALLERGKTLLSDAAPAVAGWLGGVAGSIGQWMLTPVFAFYFLRDRRIISRKLLMLLPQDKQAMVRRIFGEMSREITGYLRGQLFICSAVGALTAVGLLFCGIEAWLALGLVMGLLELIPYAGPFIGGALAVLFALPGGLSRVLWTLGVIIAVQQAEGGVLSPRLLSAATRLHPLTVILCITLGSACAGISGMLLSVPLLLCLRAVVRVWADEWWLAVSRR